MIQKKEKTFSWDIEEDPHLLDLPIAPYNINSPEDMKNARIEYNKEIQDLLENNSSNKLLEQLYVLNKKNTKRKNNNLMSIVLDPIMWAASFNKLKANKGSMTPGTSTGTADENSYQTFMEKIRQIENNDFKWAPARGLPSSRGGGYKEASLYKRD